MNMTYIIITEEFNMERFSKLIPNLEQGREVLNILISDNRVVVIGLNNQALLDEALSDNGKLFNAIDDELLLQTKETFGISFRQTIEMAKDETFIQALDNSSIYFDYLIGTVKLSLIDGHDDSYFESEEEKERVEKQFIWSKLVGGDRGDVLIGNTYIDDCELIMKDVILFSYSDFTEDYSKENIIDELKEIVIEIVGFSMASIGMETFM